MKVIISVGGKFHAFHLAKQLQKRGYLERLITSHPCFKVLNEGLPKEKIVSLPLKEILQRIWDNQWYPAELFDKQASKYIKSCDIFVGWSSFSLRCLKKAKSLGAITILERGSSHIENRRDILKEEYQRFGLKPKLPDKRIIEKELKEYQQADYISVPSSYAKRTFLERGIPEEKLIQVPYGVDIDCFHPVLKEDNTFRLIYVGTLSLRKGVHYLLRAVDELKLKNFETWLIGPLTSEVKPFFKKYKDSFRYLGPIPHTQLYKYYSQGSLFVQPSIDEGLSLVILQAMACGLPVVCTTNTGGADIMRDGIDGFIIPIRNVDALKEKILYLYENQDICRKMGEFALKKIRERFSWDNYGERIVNIYLQILKNK